jgi:hypothetical protein
MQRLKAVIAQFAILTQTDSALGLLSAQWMLSQELIISHNHFGSL